MEPLYRLRFLLPFLRFCEVLVKKRHDLRPFLLHERRLVVGLADSFVGGAAGRGQFALALSGEVRLRLGIASKLDSALGLH